MLHGEKHSFSFTLCVVWLWGFAVHFSFSVFLSVLTNFKMKLSLNTFSFTTVLYYYISFFQVGWAFNLALNECKMHSYIYFCTVIHFTRLSVFLFFAGVKLFFLNYKSSQILYATKSINTVYKYSVTCKSLEVKKKKSKSIDIKIYLKYKK